MEQHIEKEETMLFPYIENLLKVKQHGSQYFNKRFRNYSIQIFMEDHHENENVFTDIKSVLHTSSVNKLNMPFRIFLIQLEVFAYDLLIHAKVENNILIPKGLFLEKILLNKL